MRTRYGKITHLTCNIFAQHLQTSLEANGEIDVENVRCLFFFFGVKIDGVIGFENLLKSRCFRHVLYRRIEDTSMRVNIYIKREGMIKV